MLLLVLTSVVAILSFVCADSVADVVTGGEQLLLVQVIIRHGDRAPVNNYVSPEANDVYFRGGGQLSDLGIDNSNRQGAAFKKRYVDNGFIDKRYLPKQITFQASPSPRVMMSASSFGNGFFDKTPGGYPTSVSIEAAQWLRYNLECAPGWDTIYKRYGVPPTEGSSDLSAASYDQLWDKVGTKMAKICKDFSMRQMEAALAELVEPNNTIPEKLKKCAEDEAPRIAFKLYSIVSGVDPEGPDPYRTKTMIGYLVHMLRKNVQDKLACGQQQCKVPIPKMSVFYTHDMLLVAMAEIFDALNSSFPKHAVAFSSAFVLELWNGTKGPYLKLYMKNGVDADFTPLKLYGSEECEVGKFNKRIEKYVRDTPHECTKESDTKPIVESAAWVSTLSPLAATTVIFSALGHFY